MRIASALLPPGLVCLLVAVFPLTAQQRTGSISGFVRDGSGASISGASIRAEQPQTGVARTALTNESGAYTLPLLAVGDWQLTVTQPGFQTMTRKGVSVSVNEDARLDLVLTVAGAEQSISVSGDAPQVNTTNATLGVVIESEKITGLPLNGRNFTELGALIPGVVAPPQRLGGNTATTGFSVNGQRTQSNNFLLDGVSNTDPQFNGYIVVPPPDSLDQFKILTSNFAAEYGFSSGSVVSVITRAGSNDIHGGVWHFLRNDALDARNFFSATKPQLNQNQYGGRIGGPLVRNRVFFFGYYEGLRTRQGSVLNVPVFTAAERTGDFRTSTVKPRDPLTQQAFAGDMIPPSRLNPISQRLLNEFVPLANGPSTRYLAAPAVATDGEQYGVRGDYTISSRNSLFLRYSYFQRETSDPLAGSNFAPAPVQSLNYNHSAVASDTHTFAPNLLNEASISFLRQFSKPTTFSGLDPAAYGFRYGATESSALGLPIVSLTGYFSLGDSLSGWSKLGRNIYQANDNLTWITGRHSLKFGFDWRHTQLYQVFVNRTNGDFAFNGQATGNAAADFLLGAPFQFRQNGGDPSKHFLGTQFAFYAQDDWRITPRLTLNLGLRYELPIPFVDKQDRVASFQPGRKSSVMPDAPVNLVFPGDEGVPRATIGTDYTNWAPRFGFAYDVFGNGKTSVRGGFGLFYDTVPGLAVFQNINVPPFNRFVTVNPVPGFADPYAGFAVNPQIDPARRFPSPTEVIGFSPDIRTPYTQHFNLQVQQQLFENLVLDIGYVGTFGRKLAGYLEVNPSTPGPGATTGNDLQRRRYPGFRQVRPTFSGFNSNYHALQARLEKRLSRGSAFLMSYTWSKVIDYQSSVNLGGEPRPQDGFSLPDIRGLALFDTRHRFVTSYVYDIPFFGRTRSAAGLLLGGWQLSGIVSLQSGNPISVTEPLDLSLRGLNGDRPDQVSDPNDGPKTPEQWFDTSAFARLPAAPGGQRFGTAGRNTVIGPGLVQTDLALLKTIAITERSNFELRGELFNAFNRTNLMQPGTSIGAPQTFGVITQARPGRIIQVGGKFSF